MYGPTDLKKNTLITLDGQPYKVVEYAQKVMGRGGSIVNVKVKNMVSGAVIPKTFKGQEKIEPAEVENKTVQYLYSDGEKFFFMDPVSFEQFELGEEMVDSAKDFLKEGNVAREYHESYLNSLNIDIKPEIVTSNMSFIIELVTLGMGIGMVYKEAVQKELKEGKLIELNSLPEIPKRDIGIVLNNNAFRTFAVNAFVEYYSR